MAVKRASFDKVCPLQEVVNALFGPPVENAYEVGEFDDVAELFKAGPVVPRIEVVNVADTLDLPGELMDVVEALSPGDYTRVRLVINLNTILSARDLTFEYGTVD